MDEKVNPLVSVVMGVRNGLPHLDEAVSSVLAQTYSNLEFIVIDDDSSDATYECLQRHAENDSRLRLFKAEKNLGMGGARDFCIQHARGEFIAFMDADDISYAERIEQQVIFLQANLDVIIVGVQADLIDAAGTVFGEKTFPTDPAVLRKMLYLYAPLQIPTAMVRHSLLPAGFKWFEGWRYAEDTILFFKLLQFGELGNVDEKLYGYRQHPSAASSTKAKEIFYGTWKARGIGRRKYGYHAGLKARFISGLQFIAVTCIPSAWLNRVYQCIRKTMQRMFGYD